MFKLTFMGFLYIGEFTYAKIKEKNNPIFIITNLTHSDVTIAVDYTTIRLKRSKTDKIY